IKRIWLNVSDKTKLQSILYVHVCMRVLKVLFSLQTFFKYSTPKFWHISRLEQVTFLARVGYHRRSRPMYLYLLDSLFIYLKFYGTDICEKLHMCGGKFCGYGDITSHLFNCLVMNYY
ncbi:hypothetical protein L9F63_018228, partial [Diploptera punctata]